MANCGCNSTSNGGDNCYTQDNTVKQVMFPVFSNECTGNSSQSISGCPKYFEPSTLTSSGCFVVPAVGATAVLEVCDASVFRVGMWITNPALGRYPIVGVNAATNLLTLRNSCADGATAIYGNPDPGTQICGTQSIWIGGESPCLNAEEFCADVFSCMESISEDNPLCLPDVPLTTSGQCVKMMGLSAACDSGDCPQPDDPNCVTKLNNVRFCEDTIVFDNGLQVAEDEECFRPVVITEDGNVKEAPSGTGVMKMAKAKLIETNSGFTNGAGLVAAMNFQVNLADFNVPECAIGALIRGWYIYDYDTSPGEGPVFNTFIRATGQPSQNAAYQISRVSAAGSGDFPDRTLSNSFYTTVWFGPDKIMYHELQNDGTIGSSNFVAVALYLDGIIA